MTLMSEPGTAQRPFTREDEGGWTIRRLQVIDDAAGRCARCGMTGVDTATRGWFGEELVAAHTHCAVGLSPPPTAHQLAAA
jgi:hypothetical protein